LEKAGVDFVCADVPSANRLTVGIMAMVAEEEARLISKRTKDALAAVKARGEKKLGGRRYKFKRNAKGEIVKDAKGNPIRLHVAKGSAASRVAGMHTRQQRRTARGRCCTVHQSATGYWCDDIARDC
jgi:DNA invertase Pin-like site-specific DNA recombinase